MQISPFSRSDPYNKKDEELVPLFTFSFLSAREIDITQKWKQNQRLQDEVRHLKGQYPGLLNSKADDQKENSDGER